jgi:hypothetical protein
MRALVLAFLLSLPLVTAAQPPYAPVVSWLDDAAHQRAADRVLAVMQSRGLHPVATCSLGCALSVPSPELAAALTIAQDLITRERLDIELVPRAGS